MRLRSMIAGLAFVAMALAPAAVLADELINRVVAVVGDDPITAVELDRSIQGMIQRLQMMQQQRGQEMAMPPANELRYMALNSLIDEKLFNREVDRLKMGVSEEEVSMFIERLKKANNMNQQEFIARLNETGMTPEEYREKVKNDLLKRKLINYEVKNKVVISDKEVDDYLAEHPDLHESAGQVTIQALFLKLPEGGDDKAMADVRAKAEQLRGQVADGANFEEMCRANSQGPGAAGGGKIGPLRPGDLLPGMSKAIETMKPGDLSPVLDIPSGVVFLRLLSVSGGDNGGSQEVRDQVRQQLENNQLEERFSQWMKDLRANTYIQIID